MKKPQGYGVSTQSAKSLAGKLLISVVPDSLHSDQVGVGTHNVTVKKLNTSPLCYLADNRFVYVKQQLQSTFKSLLAKSSHTIVPKILIK